MLQTCNSKRMTSPTLVSKVFNNTNRAHILPQLSVYMAYIIYTLYIHELTFLTVVTFKLFDITVLIYISISTG